MSIECPVAGVCGGCAWLGRPYADQLAAKREQLASLWRAAGMNDAVVARAEIVSVAEGGLRDRTDLAFRRGEDGRVVLGMMDLGGGDVVDIGACPALSPALRAHVEGIRRDPPPPPIARASLRLRVGPGGERGIWIDAANVDIKALLDEGAWLRRRLEDGAVEMGQRRKPLVDQGPLRALAAPPTGEAGSGPPHAGRLRLLKDPALGPWFATWLDDARRVPLYGPIGGFSQPSMAANRELVGRAMAIATRTGARRWLELGSGNGNFTLPLAARGFEVTAVEVDASACEGLRRAARENGLADRIKVVTDDMHDPIAVRRRLDGGEAVLADPPRSGLRGFVDTLAAMPAPERPLHLLYVSCFAESLVSDVARLAPLGYRAVTAVAVDQFPQTPHAEWIVLLSGR